MKTKYTIVGMGFRGLEMFLRPLVNDYSDVAEVVALCDINTTRLEVGKEIVGKDIPLYTDFDRMLREVACDRVIVTTIDKLHHEFIIKALNAGKDVITEKPMTIDDEKCRDILEVEKKTGRKVYVTFNYRYSPYVTRIKELLKEKVIGDIYSVDFAWMLDTVHGADYFRRWHRRKENSGGLFVHKATHHFDLVNWWLEQKPVKVYALGSRNFYGPTRKERGERCLTCPHDKTCEFYFDLKSNQYYIKIYLNAETEDGYFRDRCVFDPEINIEDTMCATVSFNKGAQLNYSLHSFMPFEGWRVAFNGSKGRMEAGVAETFYPMESRNLSERIRTRRSVDPFKAALGDFQPIQADLIRIYPQYGSVYIEAVPRVTGGHGGGDIRLRDHLFREGISDPLNHKAGSSAGAMSILIGIAANLSMASGQPIIIEDLLKGCYGRGV